MTSSPQRPAGQEEMCAQIPSLHTDPQISAGPCEGSVDDSAEAAWAMGASPLQRGPETSAAATKETAARNLAAAKESQRGSQNSWIC